MEYKKISPLGPRVGPGTFDAIWNQKYKNLEEAKKENDVVVLNFVLDEDDIVHIQIFNTKDPENKKYHRLIIQRFPAGVDGQDDHLAMEIAQTLI